MADLNFTLKFDASGVIPPLRTTEESVRAVRAQFTAAQADVSGFVATSSQDIARLAQFIRNQSGTFETLKSGLVVPRSVAAESTRGVKQITDAVEGLGDAVQKGRGLKGLQSDSVQAYAAVTSLANVVQDASAATFSWRAGLAGVANNLGPLAASLTSVTRNGAAGFAALRGALVGPAGVLLAVSAVTTVIQLFGDRIGQALTGAAENAKRVREEMKAALEETIQFTRADLTFTLDVDQIRGELTEAQARIGELQTEQTNLFVELYRERLRTQQGATAEERRQAAERVRVIEAELAKRRTEEGEYLNYVERLKEQETKAEGRAAAERVAEKRGLLRNLTEAEREGARARIDAIQDERARAVAEANAEFDERKKRAGENADALAAVERARSVRIAEINRTFDERERQEREKRLEEERRFQERLFELEERAARARGESEIATLEARLARLKAAATDAPADTDQQREILLRAQETEIEIAELKRDLAEKSAEREGELRDALAEKEIDRRLAIENRVSEEALRGIEDAEDRRRAQIQSTFAAQVNAAQDAFELEIGRIRDAEETEEAKNLRVAVARATLETLIAEAERARIAATEQAEAQARERERRAREREEERRAIERARTVERAVEASLEAGLEALAERREFTEEEIDLERERFAREEQLLHESLANREIDFQDFNLRMRELSLERAEFEDRVTKDSTSAIERAYKAVARTVEQAILDAVKAAIAAKVTQEILKFLGKLEGGNEKEQGAISADDAGTIGGGIIGAIIGAIVGDPKAGATIGAALGKFVGGIIKKIFKFAGGGEVPGPSGETRDTVLSLMVPGEYVMTKKAVGGKPRPFKMLMSALETGKIDPEDLEEWLVSVGLDKRRFYAGDYAGRVTFHDLYGLVGVPGHQAGGLIAAGSVLEVPNPFVLAGLAGQGYLSDALAAEMEMLRSDMAQYQREVAALADRPGQVLASEREWLLGKQRAARLEQQVTTLRRKK